MYQKVSDFEIPCQHGKTGQHHSQTVPDHHPLSRDEVKKLLNFIAASTTTADYSKAVIRLCQGIRGWTCPDPLDNPAADKAMRLRSLVADRDREGGTAALVNAVMELLH